MNHNREFNPMLAQDGSGRKNSLNRMIGSARRTSNLVEPRQLSLAKIREALLSGVAIEEFETANSQGRFVRWLERTCRRAVKHTSGQTDAISLLGAGRLFTIGK